MSGQLIIGVGGNQSSSSSIPKNSVTSIDVPQDGSEVQVQVTTNTTFTVS